MGTHVQVPLDFQQLDFQKQQLSEQIMDWFIYDNGLRLESVKDFRNFFRTGAYLDVSQGSKFVSESKNIGELS